MTATAPETLPAETTAPPPPIGHIVCYLCHPKGERSAVAFCGTELAERRQHLGTYSLCVVCEAMAPDGCPTCGGRR